MNNEALINAYQKAYSFLEKKVGKDILEKQLNHYYDCKQNSMSGVLKQMLKTLKNKQGYTNFIADISKMEEIFCGFDLEKSNEKYQGKWENIFNAFKEEFELDYNFDINNKRNAWVMYSRGTMSCLKFLSNFKSEKDFDDFVKSFFYNELSIVSLPLLLEKEIFGYGFPLACDFLKELGYVQYGKPDVHIRDIFSELNLIENDSDYEIFKTIVKTGSLVKKEPVIIDKIFWLIGSGNFHESNMKIGRQKEAFYEYVKNN